MCPSVSVARVRATKSDDVHFVGLCVVSPVKTNKEEDVRLLPAFLQISSGRYPEGGRCRKSLWISATQTQERTLHTNKNATSY